MAIAPTPGGYVERPRPSGLADVIDVILDKGLVIDSYLRFAEPVNRLEISHDSTSEGPPQLMESITSGGAKSKTKGVLEGVKETLSGDDDESDGERGQERPTRSSRSSRSQSGSRTKT